MVQGRDQQSRRDTDRFLGVVVLAICPTLVCPPSLHKDADKPWRRLEEGFARIGSQWGQRLQPFLRCSMLVELAFLLLGSDADLPFQCRLADGDEMPGLEICTTGSRAGRCQTGLDHRAIDGRVGEIPNRATSSQLFVKIDGTTKHLVG